MTSRELVKKTLEFKNTDGVVPRDLWTLPWAHHKYGKKMFFHSDGFTLDIIPQLIELGYDAVNLQIFCMGIEKIAQFKSKITFWGEVDRQHLLPEGTTKDIQDAIKTVHDTLWQDGGCIAQCEFGAAAKPENVREVFASWDELTGKDKP